MLATNRSVTMLSQQPPPSDTIEKASARKRKKALKSQTINATDCTVPCALHENLYDRLAFNYGRLSVEQQLKLLEYAWGFIHPRHLLRLILSELHAEKTKPRDAKRRNAHKLINSNAERSIEVLYCEWLDFLLTHRSQCSLLEKNESDQLWHVDNGVTTNYTRGFDGYRNAEEQKFNSRAKNVKIVTPEQNTMNTIEPVYTVNVYSYLGKLSSEWLENVELSRRDETSQEYLFVETFLKNSVHARAIKLLDFTFANGSECWLFWNQVLDRCLLVYQHLGFFPVKDSVYDLTVVADENSDTVHAVPSHGGLTKLGNFTDFAQSFRILMQMSILGCCYVSAKKGPSDRLNYTKQHNCVFPAASQHAYNEIFLTSKFGHDLLCNSSMQNTDECLRWMKTFAQTRADIARIKSLRVSDKLEQFFDSFNER